MITNVYFKGAPVDYIYKGDELYYDFTFNPSEISSLSQGAEGTTPVTQDEESVVLIQPPEQ